MPTTSSRTHHRACNLCEAICGIDITVSEGQIQSIRGDRSDPFSRGHICPKAVALQDIQDDPDRLRHPMRKNDDGSWTRIAWEEAFDWAAEKLSGIRREHGRDAIAVYAGNPSVHNYGSLMFGPQLLRALTRRHRFSATSVDQLPHHVASYFMFGHMFLLPIPDVDHTDFFLVLGANPAVSNGSLMTAPGIKSRIKAIRQRGGTVVVIDPRRTRTAKLADQHLFVRPGQDALLLAALVRTVIDGELATPGRLASHSKGLEQVRAAVAPFTPERVAGPTGIEAEAIVALARAFANAPSAVCYGRIGTSVQSFGGLCQWLINVLNVITGNLDRKGGAMFTRPAVDLVARKHGGGSYGRWHSRVRNLPEFGGELPVSTLAEEMLTPGEGQIRALVTSAGNPVVSTPNGKQLERALESLDFMVSIDFYRNETTRHADLILPPTPALEHDHYDLVFNALAVRNVARYSEPLFTPPADTRHDWQIMWELERRLGPQSWSKRIERTITRRLGPHGLLALALRFGPYGSGFHPFKRGLTLGRLRRAPHGLDLGPLTPQLPDRLKTRDRMVDLAPGPMIEDMARLREALDQSQPPMVLISRRQVRSNNSWMHNSARLMKGPDRCTLQMHPRDAERLGVKEGDDPAVVRVRSRATAIEAPVDVTETIMPGVVCLPHGWGHDRDGVALGVASRQPGVSVNDLTDELRVDPLTGNAALSATPVDVEPVAR